MKISDKPNPFILVKASIQSEWDSCNCALICITDGFTERWKKWDKIATGILKQTVEFAHLSFYERVEFLYTDDEVVDEIPGDKGWVYVEMEEGEDEDELGKPEQDVDAHMVRLYGEGKMKFVAWGKHTSEEFWTETININEL